MIWTRELLYKTSGWFNQEPVTPLDETLRFPVAFEEIYRLLKEDYGIKIKKQEFKIHNGYIYFCSLPDYILQVISQSQIYLKLPHLLFRLKTAKEDFENLVQEFLRELTEVKQFNLSSVGDKEIYYHLIKNIRFEARWIIRLGNGTHTLLHYLSEIFLKELYKLLVKDPEPNHYSELLIGYPNKLLKADRALWEVVQGKATREEYLKSYGYRATEATLIKETIGENREVFEAKVQVLRKMPPPNFEDLTKIILEKRQNREDYVKSHFRWWLPLGRFFFNKSLFLARKYISVREDRRFYYTQGAYPIRQACLELGSRFPFLSDPADIFFLTKEELETAIYHPENLDEKSLREKVASRMFEWKEWQKQTPPIVIKD